MTDVIEEFNKLKQERSVMKYQNWFEELRPLMLNSQPALTEHYFVSSFFSGLMDELRPAVKMMQPATVKQATKMTRLQELALEAIFKKHKILLRNYSSTSQQLGGNSLSREDPLFRVILNFLVSITACCIFTAVTPKLVD